MSSVADHVYVSEDVKKEYIEALYERLKFHYVLLLNVLETLTNW